MAGSAVNLCIVRSILNIQMKTNLLVKVFKWSIIISIVFKSIQLLDRIYNVIFLNLVVGGYESYRNNFSFIIREIKIEAIFNYIITISFIVLLSTWFYLKYKKAHQLSRLNLTYKPIWALFSFIIPVFNLIAPYRIMNELWTVYNKDMSIETSGKNLIKTWWFLSVGLFIFSWFLGIKFDHISNPKDFLSLEYYSVILFAVSIHYYLLVNKLVKLLDDKTV